MGNAVRGPVVSALERAELDERFGLAVRVSRLEESAHRPTEELSGRDGIRGRVPGSAQTQEHIGLAERVAAFPEQRQRRLKQPGRFRDVARRVAHEAERFEGVRLAEPVAEVPAQPNALLECLSRLTVVAGSPCARGPADALAHRLCEQLSLSIFLAIAAQFAVFLRTDVYLVVQELSGCKNLYSDALARLRWLTLRAVGRGGAAPDPTLALPHHERRPVRIYALFVAVGALAALVTFACYQAPVMVETIVLAVRELGHGLRSGSAAQCTDALLVLAITVFFEGLLVYKLARKHGARLRRSVSVKARDQSVHADQTSARSAG
jgi:hypothetical protein